MEEVEGKVFSIQIKKKMGPTSHCLVPCDRVHVGMMWMQTATRSELWMVFNLHPGLLKWFLNVWAGRESGLLSLTQTVIAKGYPFARGHVIILSYL